MMPNTSWFCILLVVCVSDAAGFDTETEFIYNGFAGSNLQLDGSAYITQEGILSLTTASSDITGHGFHPNPMFVEFQGMYANPSFSTTFVFSIAPDYSSRTGEGMAFVISPAADFAAAMPGGYLGLHNYRGNTFLAIELDTVANQEFKDIDDKHVGIDLNNLVSITSCSAGYSYQDNTDNIIQLTFEELRLSSGDPMQVWVDYDGGSMNLNVTLALVPMYKPSPPLLSYTVNLSTFLPQAYVGFSASTGDKRVAAHQILGWSFKLNGLAPPLNYSLLPLKREYQIQDAEKKKLIKWLPATISSLAMVTGLTACFLLRCWCNRRRENQEDWESELGPRRFSYKILRAATNGFSSRHLLGKGGFGRVYAGVLDPSGLRIAVKRISSESSQGLAQFTAEILILGRLRHRNLVRLIGYCRHKDELLLVYEQMPNRSLDKYLNTKTKNMLIWSQRLHIIKGVASGLLYLHEDWEQVIIHRDVKASNVLLDAEMNGRLGTSASPGCTTTASTRTPRTSPARWGTWHPS